MTGFVIMMGPFFVAIKPSSVCSRRTFKNSASRTANYFVSGIIFEARFSHVEVTTLVLTQLPLFFVLLLLSSLVTILTVKPRLTADGGKVGAA